MKIGVPNHLLNFLKCVYNEFFNNCCISILNDKGS